jgi:hypothetical protein
MEVRQIYTPQVRLDHVTALHLHSSFLSPLAHVLAVRPCTQVALFVASHTIFLSSFFRFDVLV